MFKEDIKNRMTRSFKYDDRDNSKNMTILNDWLYTKDGFSFYRDYVQNLLDNADNTIQLEEAVEEMTLSAFIDDILYKPCEAVAKDIIDLIRADASDIWDWILDDLASKHPEVKTALDSSDDTYGARLSNLDVLMIYDVYGDLISVYDLQAIWMDVLDCASSRGVHWRDLDLFDVIDIVK